MKTSDDDRDAFTESLCKLTVEPMTLWELKQHVDQMVLKFGRKRLVCIMDVIIVDDGRTPW